MYKGINKGAGDLKCRGQVKHILFISNNESQSHGYNYYWRIIVIEKGGSTSELQHQERLQWDIILLKCFIMRNKDNTLKCRTGIKGWIEC